MNTDFFAGFIACLTWFLTYAFFRRVIWKEVWIYKYELERLYSKEKQLDQLDWKDFNPVVHVTYGCKFCGNK